MRHCSTENYWPKLPGYTTSKVRRAFSMFVRDYALQHHLERLPPWIVWSGEFVTRASFNAGPDIVTVTRCNNGHLTTVMHLSNEPYPRP